MSEKFLSTNEWQEKMNEKVNSAFIWGYTFGVIFTSVIWLVGLEVLR